MDINPNIKKLIDQAIKTNVFIYVEYDSPGQFTDELQIKAMNYLFNLSQSSLDCIIQDKSGIIKKYMIKEGCTFPTNKPCIALFISNNSCVAACY